jgi:hypothetical protein
VNSWKPYLAHPKALTFNRRTLPVSSPHSTPNDQNTQPSTAPAVKTDEKTPIQKFNSTVSSGAGLGLSVVGVGKITNVARDLEIDHFPKSTGDFASIKSKYTSLTKAVEENAGLLKQKARLKSDLSEMVANNAPDFSKVEEELAEIEVKIAANGGNKIKNTPPGKTLLVGGLAFIGGQMIMSWDKIAEKIREVAPAWLVNHSTQLHSTMRNLADAASTASAFWDGQRNYNRLTANAISMAALIPGLFYEEKPQTREELDAYNKMGVFEYAATKVKEAFDPKHHIRETVGMATMGNGVFNSISGFLHSPKLRELKTLNPLTYIKHGNSEFISGLLTITAGALITFVKESDKAWQLSTAVFMGRIPAKWHQAHTEYFDGSDTKSMIKINGKMVNEIGKDGRQVYRPIKPGNYWQYVSFGLQQFANILSSTMAGAHKDPVTGKIIHPGDTHNAVAPDGQVPPELTPHVQNRPGMNEIATEGSRETASETRFAQREVEKAATKEPLQAKSLMEHAETKSSAAVAL